jgi:hypothetical membrane protein
MDSTLSKTILNILQKRVIFIYVFSDTLTSMSKEALSKAAALCGIVGVAAVYPLIFLAISYYPSFSWFDNALSDLGVQGVSAIIFNTTLIFGGILLFIFSIGLMVYIKGFAGKMGCVLLLASATSLALIGLFPENYGRVHFYVSVAFFVLLVLSLLALGLHLLLESSKSSGLLTLAGAVVAALIWLLPWRGVAIPEATSSLILSARVVAFAAKMLVS